MSASTIPDDVLGSLPSTKSSRPARPKLAKPVRASAVEELKLDEAAAAVEWERMGKGLDLLAKKLTPDQVAAEAELRAELWRVIWTRRGGAGATPQGHPRLQRTVQIAERLLQVHPHRKASAQDGVRYVGGSKAS